MICDIKTNLKEKKNDVQKKPNPGLQIDAVVTCLNWILGFNITQNENTLHGCY